MILVGMIGSRGYTNVDLIRLHVKAFSLRHDLKVVTGGATGTDTIVENACKDYGVEYEIKWPDLKQFGSPAAYHIRNDEILAIIKKLFVYWDGTSRGSRSMIQKAQERQLDFSVFFDKRTEAQRFPC